MARFIDPTSTKFWEIERDGATITRRHGKLGTTGRTQTKTFDNALLARWHYGNFVGYKTHTERYVPDIFELAPAAPIEFDDDAWLVHADALQAQGDPLGELIALRHALETAADHDARVKLERATDDLERQHPALYGDLGLARAAFQFEWRGGRLHAARLDHGRDNATRWLATIQHALPDVPACYLLGTTLAALFDLPIARGLEILAIGNAGTYDYQHTMITIVEQAPPTLRSIAIRGKKIDLRGGFLAPMKFPALESLDCDFLLSQSALLAVTTASCPKLRHVAFKFVDGDVACRMLLDTPLIDQLESLVIHHWATLDPVLEEAVRQRAPFVKFAAP